MKRVIVALTIVLLVAIGAWARITLTTGATQVTSVGGTAVDTANVAAVTSVFEDYTANVATITVSMGTWNGTAFVTSTYVAPIVVTINLGAGTYSTSAGTQTLTWPQLTAVQAAVKSTRNGADTLVNSIGVAPGTITAW
jgi:hypothetical protein